MIKTEIIPMFYDDYDGDMTKIICALLVLIMPFVYEHQLALAQI